MKRNYNSIGIYSQSSSKVAKGAIDTTLQDALSGHKTKVLHINSTPGDSQSWFKHVKDMVQVNFAGEIAKEINLDNYVTPNCLNISITLSIVNDEGFLIALSVSISVLSLSLGSSSDRTLDRL